MKRIVFILCLLVSSMTLQAQKPNKNAKLSIKVDGVCYMCKKRIEKAALQTKGVKLALWDIKTHILSLIIDERKTDKKTIQKSIAGAGHDTEDIKATDLAYNSVNPCCKYRDKEVVKDHHQLPKRDKQ